MTTSNERGWALVTGASSGIGAELARLLARDGYDLALTARSADRLQALASELGAAHGVQVQTIPQDLARPGAADEIVGRLEGRPVEVLINNAGFGLRGPFVETDLAAELEMLQVNVVALTALTKLFLPQMVARGAGRILNVSSLAGLVPGPYMAVYYASKAYIRSFSESLARELRGSGVSVTALCPGPTCSEFAARAGCERTRAFTLGLTEPADVAAAGYRGLMRGRPFVAPCMRDRLLVLGIRISPRGLLAAIVDWLNRSPG